jgi:hypothetical protein
MHARRRLLIAGLLLLHSLHACAQAIPEAAVQPASQQSVTDSPEITSSTVPEQDAWNEQQNGDAPEEEIPSIAQLGSAYVPLDSWVYPAIERLAALGYVETAFLGMKPWTRMECAQMVEQAGDDLLSADGWEPDLVALQSRLQEEFAYEFELFTGARRQNLSASLESLYARGVSVSGPLLIDSYHLGQTLSYDFGRPFRRGTNVQVGASFRAAVGPAAIYARAEVQHAPAAPALPDAVRDFIASADIVPVSHRTLSASINRLKMMEAYVALNLRKGWQLSFGQQSLSWGPGAGGSFLWSQNIDPIPMLRLTQSDIRLPGFLKILGPTRMDGFFGRLRGHTYIPDPYVYGNKVNFKPLRNLEIGFGRTVIIGGKRGTPLTAKNFFLSLAGQTSSQLGSVPGDSHSSVDWTYSVPKLRNYLVFYGELYADDDFVPFQNPSKNPFRPGIYITRFPRLPKLDFHLEAASTEFPGNVRPGNLNYWNSVYRDGYTNNGNVIGNTVGRMGRSIQCWVDYWLSSRNKLQFTYKRNTVSREFVPGGGAWQDYIVHYEAELHSGLSVKSQLQYERISHFPLLMPNARNNVTTLVELGWTPNHSK